MVRQNAHLPMTANRRRYLVIAALAALILLFDRLAHAVEASPL